MVSPDSDSSPPRFASIQISRSPVLANKLHVKHRQGSTEGAPLPPTPSPPPFPPRLPPGSRRGSVSPQPPGISLGKLAKTYSRSFPLRFQVQYGFYGRNMDLELCGGEVYNAHCTKYTQVATIQDTQGYTYSVPMGSAFKFGLVRQSTRSVDHEVPPAPGLGRKFANISEVVTSKNLPTVLAVTKGSSAGVDDKSSIEEEEVLVVQGVHKPKSSTKKALKVISMKTKTEKFLTVHCTASFSSEPSLVSMYLPELVEYLSDAFPCQAFVFLDEEHSSLAQDKLVSGFLSSPVRISGSKMATSLLVSPASEDTLKKLNKSSLLEIPVEDNLPDVAVSLVSSLAPDELQVLKDRTVSLLASFNPTSTKLLADKPSSRIYKTQLALYSAIQPGAQSMGIRFETSILDDVNFHRGPSQEDPVDNLHIAVATEEAENLYESLHDYNHGEFLPENQHGRIPPNPKWLPSNTRAQKHQPLLPSTLPTTVSHVRPLSASSVSSTRLRAEKRANSVATLTHSRLHEGVHRSPSLRPPDPASFLEAQSRRFESVGRISPQKDQNKALKLGQWQQPGLGETSSTTIFKQDDTKTPDPDYISPITTEKSFHLPKQQLAFENQSDLVSSMYSQLKPVDRQTSALISAMKKEWDQANTDFQAELKTVKEELATLQAEVESLRSPLVGKPREMEGQEVERRETLEKEEVKNRRYLGSLSTSQVSWHCVAVIFVVRYLV